MSRLRSSWFLVSVHLNLPQSSYVRHLQRKTKCYLLLQEIPFISDTQKGPTPLRSMWAVHLARGQSSAPSSPVRRCCSALARSKLLHLWGVVCQHPRRGIVKEHTVEEYGTEPNPEEGGEMTERKESQDKYETKPKSKVKHTLWGHVCDQAKQHRRKHTFEEEYVTKLKKLGGGKQTFEEKYVSSPVGERTK